MTHIFHEEFPRQWDRHEESRWYIKQWGKEELARNWGWQHTNLENRTISGDRQREERRCGRSALESELGLELAGTGAGCGVELGDEEEEEGRDGEGFHCGCLID